MFKRLFLTLTMLALVFAFAQGTKRSGRAAKHAWAVGRSVGRLDGFGNREAATVAQSDNSHRRNTYGESRQPDQGATDLPVDVITLKDGAVHFEMKRLLVTFDGTLNKEGSQIDGQFKQGAGSYALSLKRVARPTSLNRPQEPKPPYPYDEEEVRYENKRDNVKLAGTLTLPRCKAPFPLPF
jgi:hypothetical protein